MNFELHIDRNKPYECGARLLVTIACAQSYDDAKRQTLYWSTCAKALWLKHWLTPEDETPITVNPRHAFRDPQTINRDFAFVSKRIQERLVAGRMSIAFLQRAILGQAEELPETVKRLSVNEMAGLVLEDAGQSEPDNVKKRVWRPSRPVIHFCAAMAVTGQQLQKAGAKLHLEILPVQCGIDRACGLAC